jgi:hypothetical protein
MMRRSFGVKPAVTAVPAAILKKALRDIFVFIRGSLMTCQAVRQPGFVLLRLLQVAVQAPPHIHLHHRAVNRHLTYIAMAGFAIETRAHVRLVAEKNKVRLVVYAIPGNWLASLPITSNFSYFMIVRRDDCMAAHTSLHRRDAGRRGAQRAGMTEQALHTRVIVSAVTESDRLLRRGQDLRASEQNTAYNPGYNQQCDDEKPA